MVGYFMVPLALHLTKTYQGRLTMLESLGVSHAPHFKGFKRVKQGNPLSHTIFNVFINWFLRNWVMVVTEEEARPDDFV